MSTDVDWLYQMENTQDAVDALWRFFDEMAAWEEGADRLFNKHGPAAKKEIRARLLQIFDSLTVADEEGRDRQLLVQHSQPPEYDRSRWTLVDVSVRTDSEVVIEVKDSQPVMAERIEFQMRKESDQWFVVKRRFVSEEDPEEQEEL